MSRFVGGLSIVSAIILLSAAAAHCAPRRNAAATYCISIVTPTEESGDVQKHIDEYLATRRFTRTSTDPGARSYEKDGGKLEVTLLLGNGPAGMIVAMFDFGSTSAKIEQAAFNQFVAGSLAKQGDVKQCGDVRGLTPPVMYR